MECRSGGAGGNHSFVFTFTNNVMSGSATVATTGTGSFAGSPVFSGNTMTVNLTGVSDVQLITVTLSGVTDSFAQVLPETAVSVNMLGGDTSGNRYRECYRRFTNESTIRIGGERLELPRGC